MHKYIKSTNTKRRGLGDSDDGSEREYFVSPFSEKKEEDSKNKTIENLIRENEEKDKIIENLKKETIELKAEYAEFKTYMFDDNRLFYNKDIGDDCLDQTSNSYYISSILETDIFVVENFLNLLSNEHKIRIDLLRLQQKQEKYKKKTKNCNDDLEDEIDILTNLLSERGDKKKEEYKDLLSYIFT